MTDPAASARPFHLDAGGDVGSSPTAFETAAVRAEADGYDGVLVSETKHDPFVALTLGARATSRVELASEIAVAFARSPMTTAVLGNDLQLVSDGRFVLGLGSQIKPHIERRFSMPWSHPAPRMREYLSAVRSIWRSWESGEKLDFRGEFYQHTLMTPFFDPGPNPFGNPPLWLAAVGAKMTEVAGEVADGVLAHSFTTRRYLDEVTTPALTAGRLAGDRSDDAVGIGVSPFVVMGNDQAELDAAASATRKQIAFYGSTPAYRGVLEVHGWEQLADALHAASRRGEWDAMAEQIDDDVLAEFAVVGSPSEVAAQLTERFGGVATRMSFNAPYEVDDGAWSALLRAFDTQATTT